MLQGLIAIVSQQVGTSAGFTYQLFGDLHHPSYPLSFPLRAAREVAGQAARQPKQVGLAMHNYHATHDEGRLSATSPGPALPQRHTPAGAGPRRSSRRSSKARSTARPTSTCRSRTDPTYRPTTPWRLRLPPPLAGWFTVTDINANPIANAWSNSYAGNFGRDVNIAKNPTGGNGLFMCNLAFGIKDITRDRPDHPSASGPHPRRPPGPPDHRGPPSPLLAHRAPRSRPPSPAPPIPGALATSSPPLHPPPASSAALVRPRGVTPPPPPERGRGGGQRRAYWNRLSSTKKAGRDDDRPARPSLR